MSKIIWDQVGERFFENGVKNGVLYVRNNGTYPLGVAWNGLVAVTEKPSGAEPNPQYADNMKYLNLMSVEEFGATIEAFTYPDAFGVCDGSAALQTGVTIGQQDRSTFGLAYRTTIGNDVNSELGYKLHLVYGALAAPTEKGYQSVNESPEAMTLSWDVTTTPVEVSGKKPTASLTIDSTKVDSAKLAALELILYGDTGVDPRLPLPAEISALFAAAAPSAIALSTIVPADAATTMPIANNIVLTFNNKILTENVVVMTALGVVVPGTKTWDAAGKVLTFDPTSNLTLNTSYIVVISGVVDIYNQALALSVKTFKTVVS